MMAKFLTELDSRLKPGRDDVWILLSPLIYDSDLVGTVIVPKGFETDYASVPRLPVIYWFWGGRQHREAAIHDFLFRIDSVTYYANEDDPDGYHVPVIRYEEGMVTQHQANMVFLEAAKARNKSVAVRYPMYWGTVLGGWTAYHKKRVGDKL